MAGPRMHRAAHMLGANITGFRNEVADRMIGSAWGNTYYVDVGHTAAEDKDGGGTFSAPFATIDFAIGQCTASQGDEIHVAPGHTESLLSTALISCDVAGIRIIGHGHGSNRPTLTFDTNSTGTIDVDAANVWIENFWFVAGYANIEQAIRVSAAHCTIKNCVFEATASYEFVDMIELDNIAADYCTIEDCRFISETAGGISAISIPAIVNELKIANCDIQGDFSKACVYSGVAHLNCRIIHNVMRNDGSADHIIEFSAAATGIIAWNAMQTSTAGGGNADVVDLGACGCVENYAADSDNDTSGVLTPPAT